MRKHLLFFGCFIFGGLLHGQGITDEFVESLFDSGNVDWYCLRSVYKLNYYIKHVGKPDTIGYRREGDGIMFSYRGNQVVGLCDITNTGVSVSVSGGGSRHTIGWYQGIFRESNGMEKRIKVRSNAFHHLDKEVVIAYYQDDVLVGPYLELTLDNTVTEKGGYQQIDSLYIDTVITANPATYEVYNDYVPRKKYPLKIGTWVYRNRSGDTLKVERYPEKHD